MSHNTNISRRNSTKSAAHCPYEKTHEQTFNIAEQFLKVADLHCPS